MASLVKLNKIRLVCEAYELSFNYVKHLHS